tara:strand:- start:9876 stop:10148 length:273 start_codon:yes stop_codon:yes gene_type:complete
MLRPLAKSLEGYNERWNSTPVELPMEKVRSSEKACPNNCHAGPTPDEQQSFRETHRAPHVIYMRTDSYHSSAVERSAVRLLELAIDTAHV